MERNKILPYISAVHGILEGQAGSADNILCDTDDGEKHTAEEGKQAALDLVKRSIAELTTIQQDIQMMKYKDFCHSYGVTA